MFFKKNELNAKPLDLQHGRVYVMRFTLRCGKVVHKVGMCHSDRATDRMMEVARSFFNTYRYVPQIELRRDKKVVTPLLVEKHLHLVLDDWSYDFEKKFDGSTEFFEDLDESVLLDYLDEWDYTPLLQVNEMNSVDYDLIVEERKNTKKKKKVGNDVLPF